MNKQLWSENIPSEVTFWDEWFKTKGLQWPEEYKFRLDPSTELQSHIRKLIEGVENPTILDVGAGPLTFLGKNIDGFPINIYPVDALTVHYNIMLNKYEINPPIKTKYCESEEIETIPENIKPDLITAQNTLDHAYDPIKAVLKMLQRIKPKGTIWLSHFSRTADNEGHGGLHQWNFYLDEENLLIFECEGKEIDVLATIKMNLPNLKFTLTNSYNEEINVIETIIKLI